MTQHSRGAIARRGALIAFEGIDGTGKSTQIALLAEQLRALGYAVVTTREPTDGAYGKKIRTILKDRSLVTPEEELRLFLADRQEHITTVIAPALAAEMMVLTDRYYFSTVAYQGAAGHDPDEILRQNETFAPKPDLVLLLTASPTVGRERIYRLRKETPDSFEEHGYLDKVATIFATMKQQYIRRIDAQQPIATVHQEIMQHVRQLLAVLTILPTHGAKK